MTLGGVLCLVPARPSSLHPASASTIPLFSLHLLRPWSTFKAHIKHQCLQKPFRSTSDGGPHLSQKITERTKEKQTRIQV